MFFCKVIAIAAWQYDSEKRAKILSFINQLTRYRQLSLIAKMGALKYIETSLHKKGLPLDEAYCLAFFEEYLNKLK